MHNFTNLPIELHLPDNDIQRLSKVSRSFRRLCSDTILWRWFFFRRNPKIISSRLFCVTRPDRKALMRMNILQGVQPHQLDQGCYINGPQSSKQHSIQISLDRSLRRGSLKRKLVNRQPLTDVIRSGVLRGKRLIVLKICKERACDPSLVSIQLHLERQFTLLQLQQRIDTRKSVRELRLLNVFQGSEDSFTVLTTANATDLDLDACNHYHLHTKGPALENQMGRRLAVDALERVGIVRDLRSLALMICPSVRGKIRQFETQQ